MGEIIYNLSFGEIPEDTRQKILQSQKDAEGLEKRAIRCPVCGYLYTTLYNYNNPIIDFRCRKCKLETPLNLAYFRRVKSKDLLHRRKLRRPLRSVR